MKNEGWSLSNKIALASLLLVILGRICAPFTWEIKTEARKCFGLEAGECLLLKPFNLTGKNSSQRNVEEELLKTSWRIVPGTYFYAPDGSIDAQFSGSAYVETNGIIRNGEFVIFDMIYSEGGYGRIEGSCQNSWWRVMRQGSAEAKGDNTQVSFIARSWQWNEDPTQSQRTILNYVCGISRK